MRFATHSSVGRTTNSMTKSHTELPLEWFLRATSPGNRFPGHELGADLGPRSRAPAGP